MQSPESSPGLPPDSIARRSGRERFATVPTHIPGVSLRAEHGVDVDILRATVEELASLAKDYTERKFQIDKLTSQQKGPDEKIKTLAATHKGLRGVQSKEDNFTLNVFPRESVTWDRSLLRESTGVAFSAIAHEDLVVSIAVPAGFQTEKGPIAEELLHQVLTQALIDLGFSEEDLGRVMETRVNLRVDEKTLEKMIKDRKVVLLAGTKEVDTTWAITVAPLRKSPES